ncbi:MAG: hypothetical protein JRJ59_03035, partial [Deltaproteobacteria bacterium]|nr:hypothetical protein [Deltaproteobacteria bacterium]
SWLYAAQVDPSRRGQARPLSRLRHEAGPDDVVLWHFQADRPSSVFVADCLEGLGSTLVVRAELSEPEGSDPKADLKDDLIARAASLAGLALAFSGSGRERLVKTGFSRVEVVPPILEPIHLRAKAQQDNLTGPLLLWAGRLVPEERVEEIIKAFYFFKRHKPQAGDGPLEPWDLAERCRRADVFVSLSPTADSKWAFTQALVSGLPVAAAGSEVSLDALGHEGLVLNDFSLAQAAEILRLLAEPGPLAQAVSSAQQSRVKELGLDQGWNRLLSSIGPLLGLADRTGAQAV